LKLLARFILLLQLAIPTAQAELVIEITKGVESALPIAIVPFNALVEPPADMAAIIAADLQRSGRFEVLPASLFPQRPGSLQQVNYDNWRNLKVDHVTVGQIRARGDGFFVQFQLADVFQRNQLLGFSFDIERGEFRRLAHHISDLIYEKLTGERGAFNTRIAYITAQRSFDEVTHNLIVADADGYNPQVVLRSIHPIMSPAWSPDGSKLAYVSFENRRAQIVVQDIYSGSRNTVSAYPGINGAPAWSPDGQRLAFTLSKDGNPEIYLYSLGSRSLTRLTDNSAIDTEPTWIPDESGLVFTSDRGGSPQLYRLDLNGGRPERITFQGDYNACAAFSPDARYMAMVHRRQNDFYIAVMDMNTNQLSILTDGDLDESPSFAPNGRMIIYGASEGGQGVLAAVSVDGRVRQRLATQGRDVREPAWSPYNP